MPISIETQKASLIAVKVPEGASDFNIRFDKTLEYIENKTRVFGKNLPNSNYEILGLVSEITEDVAKSIVEECFKNRFVDYRMISQTIDSFKYTATESLHTLLQSHGLNPKENYLLIKKVK